MFMRPNTQRILSECLLISNLPSKASRMLVDIARLAERFNMCSKAEPDKHDINGRKPGILYQFTHCSHMVLAIMA